MKEVDKVTVMLLFVTSNMEHLLSRERVPNMSGCASDQSLMSIDKMRMPVTHNILT